MVRVLLSLLVTCAVTGCATSRVVRLDTGEDLPLLHEPRTDTAPVELEGDAFEDAVRVLARSTLISGHPRDAALQLFNASLPSRAAYQARGHVGLISVEDPRRGRLLIAEEAASGTELERDYGHWCQRKQQPGDCLHLLDGGLVLDEEGKRVLAFHIALDAVWDETEEALRGMTNKDAVVAMLATTGPSTSACGYYPSRSRRAWPRR